jgi:hypothetical protein
MQWQTVICFKDNTSWLERRQIAALVLLQSYSVLLDALSETVQQEDAIPFELNLLEVGGGMLHALCKAVP